MVDNPQDDEKLTEVLKFMKKTIKESNTPWVSWKLLKINQEKFMGKKKRQSSGLYDIVMAPVTYSLVDDEPKAKNPRIYEYKIGNSYVYVPAKMLDIYCNSEET